MPAMSPRLRKLGSWLLALLIAVAAAAWIASGELLTENEPVARKEPAQLTALQDVPQVRVAKQTARQRTNTISVQARTKADKKVTVRAEANGRVVELLVDEGDEVAKGDLLARIDPQDKAARLAEAKARLDQRELELEAATRLSEKGYRARTQLAGARAEFEAAQAAVRRAEDALQDTELRAAFDGQIGERMIEVGDYLSESAELLRLIALDPIKVVAHVSERNVGKIELGTTATAHLVSGETVRGNITFIAAEAADATRTFRVEMTVPNADFQILDGMTTRLDIPLRQQTAHLVAPSVLTLADDGTVGVKTVDERDRVRFNPVEIVSDTREGVWVTGLPETVTLITVGQNFVSEGQEVAPISEQRVADSIPAGPLDLDDVNAGPPGPGSQR